MTVRARRPRKTQPSVISKDVLAKEVARILDENGLTQMQAAYIIKDSPSQISLLVTGKTRGFSAERLIRILTRLGRDVDIAVRKAKKGPTGKVRVTVR
jgi:predicted XRE-type DNA-binding protein